MQSGGAPAIRPARALVRRASLGIAFLAAAVIGVVLATPSPARGFSELRYVTRVLDGDTIEVAPPGQTSGPVDVIRFAGVNANETWQCHGDEATAHTKALVEHKWVTLSADDPSSMAADGVRYLRFVDVDGVDVSLSLLEESLAFALPKSNEPSRNKIYAVASQTAALAGEGIWDPAACGTGPRQNVPLRMIVDWDAPGRDGDNPNGQYVRIYNDSARDLSLKRWAIRDTAAKNVFPLPSFAEIPAHGYITIHVGSGTSTPTEVYLNHDAAMFKHSSGDGAFLLDPDDDIRASFVYPCAVSCSDPLQGKLSIVANWDAEGSDKTNPNGEWIDIRNTSAETVDLFDYTLGVRSHHYDFPEGTSIPSGGTLRVYVGSGRNKSDTQYWGMDRGILANSGGKIVLETYDQIEIAKFVYPCTGVCTDPMQGKIELSANYDADGLDEENPNGEWVNVTNVSDATIDLEGYVLRSPGHTYYFGADPIYPGERLRIHVGVGKDTRLEKYWNQPTKVFSNTEDWVAVTTYDQIVIDRAAWPCSPCGPVPSVEITDWQWDVPGPDDPNDEWITIRNTGTTDVDLRDWMLGDNVNRFDFADSRILPPGQTHTVFVGSGTDTETTMYWGLDAGILFSNDLVQLWTPHRDLRDCHAWGTRSCEPTVEPPTCAGRPATIVGTRGDDALIGTDGRDVIVGLGGDDYIDGAGGNDIICGRGGDDYLIGGSGNDRLNGNKGFDTVGYLDSPSGVVIDLDAGTAAGYGADRLSHIEGAVGSDHDDIIRGDGGRNVLDGAKGNDVIRGGSGKDKLQGGGGSDEIYGGPGADVADGGVGNDMIDGGRGADRLAGSRGTDRVFGRDGTDKLYGDAGNDLLDGGPKTDRLAGGSGTDTCRSGTKVGCEL